MINAISLAFGQLSDKSFRGVLWKSLGLALIVFISLWFGLGYLLANTTLFAIGWLESVIDLLGGVAVLVLTWFLFPAIVSVILGFFLEDAARAVEARHYPTLGPGREQPIAEIVKTTLRFLGLALVLNLLMLPFLLLGPVFPVVFYLVNGYLLSREYFELVALRRLEDPAAAALRKSKQTRLLIFGVMIAFALTVPFLNLLTPLIATAAMVHLVEAWRQRSA